MKSVQTTTSVVPAERQCPRCGVKLGGFGPEGLCGACLIDSGLAEVVVVPAVAPPANQLRRFGDYELLEEIARGGMGVVYRARQVSLDRVVALKMILSGELAGPEEVSRFRREAEAAARLKHPNIVAIHEVGECTGQHFFSMDYVEGRTLRQLTRDNPLPAPRAAALLKTIAEAVHYAHQQGLIHRDLKPSNVLIDVAGQPHVTDFGLAKRFGSAADLTVSGAAVGTPGYMPPEQAAGGSKTVGPLADVYALGAMLYDLLTGRPPHRAETPLETMAQTVNEEPVAPRLLNPGISRDLETIALKCLEKEPVRRYASARDLALDLGRFLSHEPIAARPSSTWYRAAKWARRRPATVALVGTIVLALVAISVVSATLGLRARTAEGLATRRLNEVTAERNQKEQARQAAEAAREEAEGISKFLAEVFQSPEPGRKGGGRTTTVAASLDAAVVKLEKDGSLNPKRLAKLQTAIGKTYRALGLYPEAIALQEKVLANCQTSLGPEHHVTLMAMHQLAQSWHEAGRQEEALKLQEEVLTFDRKVLGPEHYQTLQAMNNLANYYHAAGRPVEALKLCEDVLTLFRKVLGPEHPETLLAMNNLAASYNDDAGRLVDALKLCEDALTLCRKVLGPEHPETLSAMYNLARLYSAAGRPEDAIKLLEEVLPLYREVFEPEHPNTLSAINNLANSYHNTGRPEDAIKLLEEVLPLCRKVLRPEDPKTLLTMKNLAICYEDAGRPEEALKLLEEVLTLSRNVFGPEHTNTLSAMSNLANSYNDAGRPEDALKLREEILPLSRKVFEPEHPKTIRAMHNLAFSYHNTGRREEALKLYEDVLTLCRKVLQPEHPHTLLAMNNLAICYDDAGRPEEALKLREEAGRLGDVRKLREEPAAAQAGRSNPSPTVSRAGTADNQKYARADASYRKKQYAEAEALYREVLLSQLQQFPATNESCLQTAASLARNLADWAWADRSSTNAVAAYDHALEAEHLLRDSFETRQRGTNSWRLADVKSRLGFARIVLAITDSKLTPETRATRFKDAEPLLLESAAALQADSRISSLYKRDALERLVRLYGAWNRQDKLVEWKQKLEALD